MVCLLVFFTPFCLKKKTKQNHIIKNLRYIYKFSLRDVDNLDEPIYTVKHAHVGTVNSICGKGSETTSPEIATGGRDGKFSANNFCKIS